MPQVRYDSLAISLSVLSIAFVRPTAAALPGETKQQMDKRMKWWRDAKFGIFIHWGLYAVPAGQWNGKRVPWLQKGLFRRIRG